MDRFTLSLSQICRCRCLRSDHPRLDHLEEGHLLLPSLPEHKQTRTHQIRHERKQQTHQRNKFYCVGISILHKHLLIFICAHNIICRVMNPVTYTANLSLNANMHRFVGWRGLLLKQSLPCSRCGLWGFDLADNDTALWGRRGGGSSTAHTHTHTQSIASQRYWIYVHHQL